MRSKVARRILLVFLLSLLLAVVIASAFSATRVDRQLLQQANVQLNELSLQMAASTTERLGLLADILAAGQARAGGPRFTEIRTSSNLGRLLAGAEPADPASAARHLRNSGTLLVTGEGNRILLVQRTAAGSYVRGTIDPDYLWQSIAGLPAGTGLCVTDGRGLLLHCSEALSSGELWALMSRADGSATEPDDDAVVGAARAPLAERYQARPWHFLSFRPRQLVLEADAGAELSPLMLTLLAVLVLLLIAAEVQRTVEPLGELLDATGRVASGDFARRVELSSRDEFEQLGASFNTMAERLGRQFSALETLAEFDRLILTSPETRSLVPAALARLRELTDAGWLAVVLREEGRWQAYVQDGETLSSQLPAIVSRRFAAVLEDAESGYMETDPERLPDPLSEVAARAAEPATFLMPISDQGVTNGLIAIERPATGWRERLDAVRSFADRLAVALAAVEREQRLFRQANFDPLTGLPNRVLFRQRLEAEVDRAHRDGFGGAVIFLDLNDFKRVNDTVGHWAGDLVLRQVAERLVGAVREELDTVARLGGDEFTVLVPGLVGESELAELARRLAEVLERPYCVDGSEHGLTASVGIARYPQDGRSSEEILHNADSAMYESKGVTGSPCGVAFFSCSTDEQSRRRLRLAADLAVARERGEMELHYQPQMNVRTGRVTGIEALVRWRHPDYGLLGPDSFIPLAEESDQIRELGRWVLEEACSAMAGWRRRGIAPARIGVNVSPLQFRDRAFPRDVYRALSRCDLDANCLDLEITERLVAGPGREMAGALQQLSRLGVRLTVDDFGTGYSGFGFLRRLPFQALKVDRSFVSAVPDCEEAIALVRAILALAAALDKDLVVEGVETEAQLAFFREQGCAVFQGYLFSKPLPAVELETLLCERNRSQVA